MAFEKEMARHTRRVTSREAAEKHDGSVCAVHGKTAFAVRSLRDVLLAFVLTQHLCKHKKGTSALAACQVV